MYKKIVLVLSALIIFSLPYQQQATEAAIVSKVASKGAQKIVKEVIKEIAVDTAVSYVVNETFRMVEEEKVKYKAQQDYEIFCGKKMPDLITCEKPMQVKTILTMTDKDNIGTQSEIELDKLITSGKGFTRWQKFLDWFLPIWLISFGTTALTYAFDSDTRSLLNEAAYNALVALGLIQPVIDQTQVEPIDPSKYETNPLEEGKADSNGNYTTSKISTSSSTHNLLYDFVPDIPSQNTIMHLTYTPQPKIKEIKLYPTTFFDSIGISRTHFLASKNIFPTAPESVVMYKNGLHLETLTPVTGNATNHIFQFKDASYPSTFTKINSVILRSPYQIDGFWYYDLLFDTVEGDYYELQAKAQGLTQPSMAPGYGSTILTDTLTTGESVSQRVSYFTNQEPFKKILLPVFDEIADQEFPQEKYTNENGTTLVPPSSLPYTQTSTGIQLEPTINADGEIEYKAPTGEIIPEEDITVGDPKISDDPEGNPQVEPPPTPSNPSPEPIPLTPPQATPEPTPDPTLPPQTPPPPVETTEPYFPEGESCSVGLKLPRLLPLLNTISESFPFSIPFDLYGGFQAIFAEMGSERPEFEYTFDFNGKQETWKISIPEYFDQWKEFSDSFLIFIFDVGIIYAIYRFMGGGS